MSATVLISEESHAAAQVKLDQAEKLAELLSLYQPVNAECEGLIRNCAAVIMDYVHEATELLSGAVLQKETSK